MFGKLIPTSEWANIILTKKYQLHKINLVDKITRSCCILGILAIESEFLIIDKNFNILSYNRNLFQKALAEKYSAEFLFKIALANYKGASLEVLSSLIIKEEKNVNTIITGK